MSFHTHRDVLRRTAIIAVIASVSSAAMALLGTIALFGADPTRTVSAGDVVTASVVLAATVAAILSSAMGYRSSLILQRLALIRAELWRVSRTDQLTGLLNRLGFAEAAQTAIQDANRENVPTVAMMCDVDRFKNINDEFGHQFGDAVLAEMGNLLSHYSKNRSMIVGRHGGEEFVALLFGSEAEEAMQTAEAIREACAARDIMHGGVSTRVTVSIGLSLSDRHPMLDILLRDADRALYHAKENGRNRVVLMPVAAAS